MLFSLPQIGVKDSTGLRLLISACAYDYPTPRAAQGEEEETEWENMIQMTAGGKDGGRSGIVM